MAHDVFISHSSRDKPAADAVCNVLERSGIRCWIAPRDVLVGSDWASSIVAAIGDAAVFVLVFSASSNGSPQVAREVALAIERGKTIVPFRIESVTPSASLEYYLRMPHWLDAFPPPLDHHLERLVGEVERILGTTDRSPQHSPLPPPRWPLILTASVFALTVAVAAGIAFWPQPNVTAGCTDPAPLSPETDADRVSAFSYRNNGSNDPRDHREWSRVKSNLWMERDNDSVKYLVIRRDTRVGACNGSIASSSDEPELEIFIARKDCATRRLMFRRRPSCQWIGLPKMEDVE